MVQLLLAKGAHVNAVTDAVGRASGAFRICSLLGSLVCLVVSVEWALPSQGHVVWFAQDKRGGRSMATAQTACL